MEFGQFGPITLHVQPHAMVEYKTERELVPIHHLQVLGEHVWVTLQKLEAVP